MTRVVVFGVFDPLHEGHRFLFQEARALGDSLYVVVARDSFIRNQKHGEPSVLQDERLRAVQADASVGIAVLGDEDPSKYRVLREMDFDILALGYDQSPSDAEVQKILHSIGKEHVRIVRIGAHKPDTFKSSLIRKA